MRYILFSLCMAIFLSACQNQPKVIQKENPQWTSDHEGVWTAQIGKNAQVDLLTTAGVVPRSQALEKLGAVTFPLKKEDIYAEVRNGKTYLQLPLEKGEQIYGLGLNFKNVHQRGRIFRLHVDHYGGRDNGRTHAPVPFYVSSEGYGVLIDVAKYSEWERLRQIILGFGEYDKFFLLQDLETNLLYLGDVNLGGHLPQARITRIQREDIFEKSEFLKSWYQNYSENFWLK